MKASLLRQFTTGLLLRQPITTGTNQVDAIYLRTSINHKIQIALCVRIHKDCCFWKLDLIISMDMCASAKQWPVHLAEDCLHT